MATTAGARHQSLSRMLQGHRREAGNAPPIGIDDVRGARPTPVPRASGHAEADLQGDIELALVRIRADTLDRIDAASVRLEAGEYGLCGACGGEISGGRLRGLPFAARCAACEEKHLQDETRLRWSALRSGGRCLFGDLSQD